MGEKVFREARLDGSQRDDEAYLGQGEKDGTAEMGQYFSPGAGTIFSAVLT